MSGSNGTSPARSMQGSDEKTDRTVTTAPATPPQQVSTLAVAPTVSPVSEQAELQSQSPRKSALTESHRGTPTRKSVSANSHMTPPTSPSRSNEVDQQTPRRAAAAPSIDTHDDAQRTPRASVQLQQTHLPSPKLPAAQSKPRPVTMAVPIERNASTSSRDSTGRPQTGTQGSSRSSQRHRKGLSTDKAFFSRFLGSSTTSVDKTDATGQGSRSRTTSQNEDEQLSLQRPAPGTDNQREKRMDNAPVDEFIHDNKRGAGRRKALSLVVDPFGRSSNGPASANRNRRSVKVQNTSRYSRACQCKQGRLSLHPASEHSQACGSANLTLFTDCKPAVATGSTTCARWYFIPLFDAIVRDEQVEACL